MKMKRMYGLALLILVLLFTACGKSSEGKWQEQYDLGMQYLTDGDYEAAIVAFTAAIEIDPKETSAYIGRGNAYALSGDTEENLSNAQADYETVLALVEETLSTQGELTEENRDTLAQAYLGIADVYIRRGDYDGALEILQEGLEKTDGNEEIAAKIEEIESGTITDSSGNIRKRIAYDGNGSQQWYHEFTYNADGTQASITSYDSSGSQTGHVDFAYDENGYQVVSYYYDNETGEVCKIEYEYDDSGNCERAVWYEADGSLSMSLYYYYDSDGNIATIEYYGSDGESHDTEYYEYDDQGNATKMTHINYQGNLSYYQTYEYNSVGNRVRTSHYDSDGELNFVQIAIGAL